MVIFGWEVFCFGFFWFGSVSSTLDGALSFFVFGWLDPRGNLKTKKHDATSAMSLDGIEIKNAHHARV